MLQMSSVLEMQALRLRFDALKILQATLCGSATSNLWTVLENFFGVSEDIKEKAIAEAKSLRTMLLLQREEQSSEEKAKAMSVSKAQADAEQPAGDTTRVPEHAGGSDTETLDDSDDEADSEESSVPSHPKSPARATQEMAVPEVEKPKTLREIRQNVSASSKRKYKTKCSVSEADLVYPTDEDSRHQTGVPDRYIGYRQKLSGYKGAYECLFDNCDYVAQTRGVVCSHLRRCHLGRALGCPYCPGKAWFQTRYWAKHMRETHPAQLWYPDMVFPEGPLEAKEVSASDLMISEEHLIFPPNTKKVMKIEPVTEEPEDQTKDVPAEEEENIQPQRSQRSTRKRRIVESSSEDDSAPSSRKSVKGPFGFEPTDSDCVDMPPSSQIQVETKVEVHSTTPDCVHHSSAKQDGAIVIEDDSD